jgi:formamidopyrimidine-DNA glycosylase
VVLNLGGQRLFFLGLRLGYLHLLSSAEVSSKLADLGPEPLSREFSLELFRHMMGGKRGVLKTTLVKQQFISGIGNCYSDEICFDAQIHPLRKIQQLTKQEANQLYQSIRSVLTEAISKGGYMEFPFYKGDMLTGGMDEHCKVYDRQGEPCVRCGSPIHKQIVSSRKVFHCGTCQH